MRKKDLDSKSSSATANDASSVGKISRTAYTKSFSTGLQAVITEM